jgi:hypothetical protein
MTNLTIQAVCGAIRATKGIEVSAKSTRRKSRMVRSSGVYAEVLPISNEIRLNYSTHGYSTFEERAKKEMPKVIETLESRGFKVVKKLENMGYGQRMREILIVEVA